MKTIEHEIDFRPEADGSYTLLVDGIDWARFDGENALAMAYRYGKALQYEYEL